MADRKITYQVGFLADTSLLHKAVDEAVKSLLNLGIKSTMGLTESLKESANVALNLAGILQRAWNVDTGKLDLVTFNKELKQSGLTLEQYANTLVSLGPKGEEAFLQVANAVMRADLPLRRTSEWMDKLWTTMLNTLRWQLTSSMLHGFMGAILTAYGYAQDLNESLNNIRIVTGLNTEQMARFAEQANRAAHTLSTTTLDYTDAALIYYQLGLTDQLVEDRTNVTVKLANAAGESAEYASELLTAIWNNFYDGTRSLESYADALVALGASTASSSEEISAGVLKFAAVANTVGLSYDYATAALATLTATTRESADIIGTSLRTLFARFSSLKLGETLEDGVDLNKYTLALATVGINVLDANGNLKEMDDILDSTMSKWHTLTEAQKTALATTVAGVRQYSQFMALMENSDFFYQNVATAQGSEGALLEQANIYAESWEAARDRVKNAAQDIYSAIINEDMFIDMDNAITPILHGIADIVEGLGGLKGILPTIASLFALVYSSRINNSIRDMAVNLGLAVGYEKQRARAILDTAAELAADILNRKTGLNSDTQEYEILLKLMRLRQLINASMETYTEELKDLILQELNKLDLLLKQYDEIYKISRVESLERALDSMANAVSITKSELLNLGQVLANNYNATNLGRPRNRWTATLINYRDFSRALTERLNVPDLLIPVSFNLMDSSYDNIAKSINNLKNLLASLGTARGAITEITQSLKSVGDLGALSAIDAQKLHDLLDGFGIINLDAILTPGLSIATVIKELEEAGNSATYSINGIINTLEEFGYISQDDALKLQTMTAEFGIAGRTAERMAAHEERLNSALERTGELAVKTTQPIVDYASVLTSITSGLFAGLAALSGMTRANEIFSDSTLSASEKTTQFIGVLTSLTPVITTIAKAAGDITNPLGWISLAITALSAILPPLINLIADLFNPQWEKASDILNKTTEEVKKINNELEINKKRIEEILNLEIPTLATDKELKDLERKNRLLETQVALLKEKLLQEAVTLFNTYTEDIEKGRIQGFANSILFKAEDYDSYSIDTTKLDKRIELLYINAYNQVVSEYQYELKDVSKGIEKAREYAAKTIIDIYGAEIEGITAVLNSDKAEERLKETLLEQYDTFVKLTDDFAKNIALILENENIDLASAEEQVQFYMDEMAKFYQWHYLDDFVGPTLSALAKEQPNLAEALINGTKLTPELLKELYLFGLNEDAISNAYWELTKKFLYTLGQEAGNKVSGLSIEDLGIALQIPLDTYSSWDELLAKIAQYKQEIADLPTTTAKYDTTSLNDLISALKTGKELSKEQEAELNRLEKEYVGLAVIRNKLSTNYLNTLRAIRELLEKVNIGLAFDASKNATNALDLLNADRDFEIAIRADIDSNVEELVSEIEKANKAAEILSNGLAISGEDAQKLFDIYGATILENAEITKDGIVLLNEATVAEAKAASELLINNSRLELIGKLTAEAEYYETKAAAANKMADLLFTYSSSEQTDAVQSGKAKEKVEEQLAQAKNKIIDAQTKYQDEAEKASATAEQGYIKEVGDAEYLAAKSFTDNWIEAYDTANRALRRYVENSLKGADAINAAWSGQLARAQQALNLMHGSYLKAFSGTSGVTSPLQTKLQEVEAIDWDSILSGIDWDNPEDYRTAADLFRTYASVWEEEAATIRAKMMLLNASVNSIGKSAKSGSEETAKLLDKLAEVLERYHEITREIAYQERALQKLDSQIDRTYGTTRLTNYEKKLKTLNRLAELENEKLAAAREFLNFDTLQLKELGLNAIIDPLTGELENYTLLTQLITDEYNATIDELNATVTANPSYVDTEEYEKKKKNADEYRKNRLDALKNFEDSLDKISEQEAKVLERLQAIQDIELDVIEAKLQFKVDAKEMREVVRNFRKSVEESIGETWENGAKVLAFTLEGADDELSMLASYRDSYSKLMQQLELADNNEDYSRIQSKIKELQSDMAASGDAILLAIDNWENAFVDALDSATERFNKYIDALGHNSSVAATIKELMELQGLTYKTEKGFAAVQQASRAQLLATLAQGRLLKQEWESLKDLYSDAIAKLDAFDGDPMLRDRLVKNADALLEQMNAAEEAMLSSAKESMDLAREMYETLIEEALYSFDRIVSNNLGLDFLRNQFDHYIDTEERYFDQVNTAYEIASWLTKLLADIDKTVNAGLKARLKALLDEINVRAENNTLNLYDLDILEAKYNQMQAIAALEDARNNKNTLRLVRDSQGNWNYQYTNNPEDVAKAEQDLAKANNDYYNVAKKLTLQITSDIIDMWAEARDAIRDAYSIEDIEERLKKIAEITEYYTLKAADLEREKLIAIKDMTEAGNLVIDGFSNNYASDLNLMTQTNKDFKDYLKETIDKCEEYYKDYQGTVHEVTNETGTDTNALTTRLGELKTSTHNLAIDGSSDWDKIIGKVLSFKQEIDNSLTSVQLLITELSKLNGNGSGSLSEMSTRVSAIGGYRDNFDYSAAYLLLLSQGKLTDDVAKQLLAERNAKVLAHPEYGQSVLNNVTDWGNYVTTHASLANLSKEFVEEMKKQLENFTFATGGYTGEFSNGRLAILHEKELVLNQEDTKNILAAVTLTRAMVNQLEHAIDGSAAAGMALMGSRLSSGINIPAIGSNLDQTIHIDSVEFPNATSASEIQEAFRNIADNAVQWARLRKS